MAHNKKGAKAVADAPAEEPQDPKAAFLESLAKTGSVTESAADCKIPRRTVYNWRADDEAFAAAWEEAVELGTDALEDEAVRRAKNGSDTLLIFMLKGRRPEKFKDRVAAEHTGKDGGPIRTKREPDLSRLTDDELDQYDRLTAKALGLGSDPAGEMSP